MVEKKIDDDGEFFSIRTLGGGMGKFTCIEILELNEKAN